MFNNRDIFRMAFRDIVRSGRDNFKVTIFSAQTQKGKMDNINMLKDCNKKEFTEYVAKNRNNFDSYEKVGNICYFTLFGENRRRIYVDYEI